MTINHLEKRQKTDKDIITNKIKEANVKLESIEKKYAFEGLEKNVYQRFKAELLEQLRALSEEISKLNDTTSNPEKNKFLCNSCK